MCKDRVQKGAAAFFLTAAVGLSVTFVQPAYSDDATTNVGAQGGDTNVVTRTKHIVKQKPDENPKQWWKYGKSSAGATTVKSEPVAVAPANYGNVRVATAYPTGRQASSVILLEKIAPRQVGVGEPFDYILKVTNLTDLRVEDVSVTDKFPANFKVASTDPKANSMAGNVGNWQLGEFAPHESKTITVKGSAAGTGTLTQCANVDYTIPSCIDIEVVEPRLKLVQSAPSDVLLCDLIPIKYEVCNPGSGTTKDAIVTAALPAGLKTLEGQTSVNLNAGPLAPGACREFTVNARATKAGAYTNKSAAAAGSLRAASNVTKTTVHQPVLAIEQTCPKTILLGRTFASVITVRNTGDAASANTVLEATVPAGASLLRASDSGLQSEGKVVWNLGSLAAKGSKEVTMTLSAGIGTHSSRSSVKGACADAVADTCSTKVIGIPAILLEVVDVEDPIEVGANETYIITATNQGTLADTNIKIVATLEANQAYVSSGGATNGTAKGAVITFAPLASLAPKAKATWKVVVKAVKEGDVRFKVSMTSDQLTRSVDETEATYLYK